MTTQWTVERDHANPCEVRIESAELFALNIPFVMPLSHATHKNRAACDSVVLQLTANGVSGHGEVVVRDYVSGALGGGADLLSRVAAAARRLLEPLLGREADRAAVEAAAGGTDPDPADLPVLCAVQTAVLDLACRASGRDAYELLGLEPRRTSVAFSGVIPLFPPEIAARTLAQFARLGTRSFKIKLGSDPAANRAILAACRAVVGPRGELRVDANGGWRVEDAGAHLDACAAAEVTAVEQPFPVAAPGRGRRAATGRGSRFPLHRRRGVPHGARPRRDLPDRNVPDAQLPPGEERGPDPGPAPGAHRGRARDRSPARVHGRRDRDPLGARPFRRVAPAGAPVGRGRVRPHPLRRAPRRPGLRLRPRRHGAGRSGARASATR